MNLPILEESNIENIAAFISVTSKGQTVQYPYRSNEISEKQNEIEPLARKIAQSMSNASKNSPAPAVYKWEKRFQQDYYLYLNYSILKLYYNYNKTQTLKRRFF